jgi:putative addiction module component (TIGR02574 family)
MAMSAFESLLEQALRLSDTERAALVAELLRSLDPDDEDGVTGDEWEDAWSAEIDRRIKEANDSSAKLIDGDRVLAKASPARRPSPVKP